MSQDDNELRIEYTFEKASEHINAFSEDLEKFAQTDDKWFWNSLEDLHNKGSEIVRQHLAHLNHVDAC